MQLLELTELMESGNPSLGQNTAKNAYAVAKANNLDINDCYLVRAPIAEYLMSNINGIEIGVDVHNDGSLKMNTENLDMLKQKFKHNREYNEKIQEKYKGQPIPPEEVLLGATTGIEYQQSFKQIDNIITRIWKYISYKTGDGFLFDEKNHR